MGKTARKRTPQKRSSGDRIALAHQPQSNVRKAKLAPVAKRQKVSKAVKRGAAALVKGHQVSQAGGRRLKPGLPEMILREGEEVVIHRVTPAKKACCAAEVRTRKQRKHARTSMTGTPSESVARQDNPKWPAECIWEVNASSSETDGTTSVSISPTGHRKDTVSGTAGASGKTAVHESPSITVVDLGQDFRSGIQRTVSLTPPSKVNRKKNREGNSRSQCHELDKHPDITNVWTSLEGDVRQGSKPRSPSREEKPMQSVFVVDLGNQSHGNFSRGSPSPSENSKGKHSARSTTSSASPETSSPVFRRGKTGRDTGSGKKCLSKKQKKKTSAEKVIKKLKTGKHLKADSSSEKVEELVSAPAKETPKRKKKKDKDREGTPLKGSVKLFEEEIQLKERGSEFQDEGVHSDGVSAKVESNRLPSGEDSLASCLSEPALDVTTEASGEVEDDDGPSPETENHINEGEGVNEGSPGDYPMEQDVQSAKDDNKEQSYRILKLLNSEQCLLLLRYPGKFSFHGQVLLRSLHGCITVLGFTISDSTDHAFHPLYSPNSSCALCVETLPSGPGKAGGSAARTLMESLEAFLAAEDEIALSASLQGLEEEFTVALVLKKMSEDHAVTYVERFPGFGNLFSSPEPRQYTQREESCTSNLAAAAAVGIRPTTPSTPGAVFDTLPGYRAVADSISGWLRATDATAVVLVCGWKNSGKSMLCRYLSNSLIASMESLCYLECDMAQTEFTAPGLLSLQHISQPLLGPPFTHSRKAEMMCFYGDVNVRGDPESYLRMIQYLFQQYQTRHPDKPLIINTMGWMQGLGLQLLMDIARITRPTHIVQLWSGSQPRLVPRLTLDFLGKAEGWRHHQAEGRGERDQSGAEAICPEILQVDAPNLGDQAGTKYKASDHRTMALLASLSNLQPSPLPLMPVALSSLTPLVLPWKAVAVHVTSGHVAPRHIMYALNGSIVGLCCADPSKMRSLSVGLPRVFDSTPVCQCLGLGIIRGIDPVQKVFYILTDVSQDALQMVNTLLKGSLTLPQPLLTQGHRITDVPYISREFSSVVVGSSAIKVRRNIKQRGR